MKKKKLITKEHQVFSMTHQIGVKSCTELKIKKILTTIFLRLAIHTVKMSTSEQKARITTNQSGSALIYVTLERKSVDILE